MPPAAGGMIPPDPFDGRQKRCGHIPKSIMRKSLYKKLLQCVAIVMTTGVLLVLTYLCYVFVDSGKFYDYAKCGTRGWIHNPHASDPELGFKLSPGKTGEEFYPIGPNVTTRVSKFGFRIPVEVEDVAPQKRPIVLSLGCSFTFGASCPAEDTYVYQFAKRINGTAINAGVSSYGLSHMLLLARRLIPQLKPDVVIVQYSPWLIDRSTGYVPSYYAKVPGPIFYKDTDGKIDVHAPSYLSPVFDMTIEQYRDCKKSLADRLHFFFSIVLPLKFDEDRQEIRQALLRLRKQLPQPITDRQVILETFYKEIDQICKDNGTTLFILALDSLDLDDAAYSTEKDFLRSYFGPRFIDPKNTLIDTAKQIGKTPKLCFTHVRNGEIVDLHPNAAAHELYAKALFDAYSAQ